jgi:hypothetical protein
MANKTQKYILLIIILLITLCCGCGKTINRTVPISNVSTIIELFQGTEIIANNYHIYLRHCPVISTESVSVRVDGKTITSEVDFVMPKRIIDASTGFYITSPEATLAYLNDRADPSDGYQTGTIKILKSDLITSTSEVTVIYTYYKNIAGKYVAAGESTIGPYYLKDVKNVVPGSEMVSLSQIGSSTVMILVRNSSFEPDVGDYGYTFNYNKDNPSVTFNKAIGSNENFNIWLQKYVL